MNYERKLYLIEKKCTIYYSDKQTNISLVRNCLVKLENSEFKMIIDERFNSLDFIYNDNPDDPFKYSNELSKYLESKFDEFISGDFRYKIGNGYEGTKNIKLEDFINSLKVENRDILINEIIS